MYWRGYVWNSHTNGSNLWITAFNPKALILVDANNFKEIKKIPINQEVAHGLARVEDGIWCADRRAKEIIKYDVDNGDELEKIKFPKDGPDPHGLSIDNNGTLWYCDAVHPPPTTRDFPEIGTIQKWNLISSMILINIFGILNLEIMIGLKKVAY